MRIISGAFRGRKLERPPEQITRPTAERVRQALFNILEHAFGVDFDGTRVIDICAGSGALGLEALSRGATHCMFVENEPQALNVLKANITHIGVNAHTKVLNTTCTQLPKAIQPVDIIFFDPPYGKGLEVPTFQALIKQGWLTPQSLVILETEGKSIPQAFDGFTRLDSRTYGRVGISFWGLDKS